MSPLDLRRYRAERLLRSKFEGLREQVLSAVRSKLFTSHVTLSEADLEACYATAWQALYAAILSGEQIEHPAGWLVTVVFRRAIDEHRARSLPGRHAAETHELAATASAAGEQDFAAELDDRMQLRQLFEGIAANMSERERQAAALCCLQGISRAEAAKRIGIGARRMERLMDGSGPGRPGVTAKLGALAETIAAGRFCEQQASLMRAFAFGILDPEGERYRLAVAHQRSCPACRAYVLQLRGLAAALPPVFLPGVLRLLGHSALAAHARAPVFHRRPPAFHPRPPVFHPRPRLSFARPAGIGFSSLATAKLAVTGLVLAGAGVGVATFVAGGEPQSPHSSPHARQAPSLSTAGPLPAGTAAPRPRDRIHRRAAKAKVRRNHKTAPGGSKRLHAISRRGAAAETPAQQEFSFERPSAVESAASPTTAGTSAGSAQALREFGIE